MYVSLTSAIVDADAGNRQELAAFLTRLGVQATAQLASVEPLNAVLAGPNPPQLVIINLDPGAHERLAKVSHLPRQYPSVNFFLMSQVLDPHLLMDAMHAGVKEFIPLPMSEDKLTAAVERVAQGFGMHKKARVIQVIPTMGGCGSTTVACNVAASLARDAKTCLVDLDLVRGGVGGYFDVRPRYTIADVMESAEKVDKQLLDNALTMHAASGLAILSRPDLPEETQRVTQGGMTRLMGVLARVFDYVVIDSMMSIDPIYSTVLAACDVNLMVMQLNVPSAKNAERFVGALRRMGVEASKIRLVVNRHVKKGADIEPDEVERALGLKISWMVPNDFKNAIAAINFGEPVVLRAPRSEISTSLIALANSLTTRASEPRRTGAAA
jgi:pilus assembly protein CpaE